MKGTWYELLSFSIDFTFILVSSIYLIYLCYIKTSFLIIIHHSFIWFFCQLLWLFIGVLHARSLHEFYCSEFSAIISFIIFNVKWRSLSLHTFQSIATFIGTVLDALCEWFLYARHGWHYHWSILKCTLTLLLHPGNDRICHQHFLLERKNNCCQIKLRRYVNYSTSADRCNDRLWVILFQNSA